MTLETDIIAALFKRMGSAPLPAGATIKWPDRTENKFTPPPGAPYVEVAVTFNDPINADLSGGSDPIMRGFLQVTVRWPVDKLAGSTQIFGAAGSIRSHFAFNTTEPLPSGHLRVTEEPQVVDGERGSTYKNIHVVVPWHAYP